MSRRPSATTAFVGAAVAGMIGGWWLARRHDRIHQSDLFSARPYRRFAALGWIASRNDPGTLQVLRDYVDWEPVPALRRRARRIAAAIGSAR